VKGTNPSKTLFSECCKSFSIVPILQFELSTCIYIFLPIPEPGLDAGVAAIV
jgi:hypothetical protein